MRAVIFANGVISHPTALLPLVSRQDWIMAANGGFMHCLDLGLVPHVIVGDLDSLPKSVREKISHQKIEVFRHPPEKDQTDLELAVGLALEKNADPIFLIGTAGGRWDMTLANFLLPAVFGKNAERIRLLDPPNEARLLMPGREYSIAGSPGDLVSLIPISEKAEGVYLDGLKYPLNNHTILLGSTLGVSNELAAPEAKIRFSAGLLICVITRGLPGPSDRNVLVNSRQLTGE